MSATYQVRVDHDGELHDFGPVVSSLDECTTITRVLTWCVEQLQSACVDLTLSEEQTLMMTAPSAVRAYEGGTLQALRSDGAVYEQWDEGQWIAVQH